jgi:hypothetical protein
MKIFLRPKFLLIWAAVCILAGVIFSNVFHLSFWFGVLIAAVAMFVNGLVAEWEDRQPGGFLNPNEEPKDGGPSAS